MAKRRPNPRLAKLHHSYTVEEAARLLKVHENTVRGWLDRGLPAFAEKRPTLIRGPDLRQFLTEERSRAKTRTLPGHLYCLPCRDQKVPDGGMVDLAMIDAHVGNLSGICPDCSRMMNRRVRARDIESVCVGLDLRRFDGPAARRSVTGT